MQRTVDHGCRHGKGNQAHIQGKLPFYFGIQVEKAIEGLNHQPQQNHADNAQHQAIQYALPAQFGHLLDFACAVLLGNHRIKRGHDAEEGYVNSNECAAAQCHGSQISFACATGHYRIHEPQPHLRNLRQ